MSKLGVHELLWSGIRSKMSNSNLATHFNLFTIRNFLDPETCASIKAEARSSPTTQAPVYIEGSTEVIHQTVRKTTSLHPSAETISAMQDRLFQHKSSLEHHFNQSLVDCEPPQFLRYESGDFFVRHQDGNTEQLEFDHLRIRKISIIVFLNDSSLGPKADCFCGGSLNFYDHNDVSTDSSPVFGVLGETGMLVAFSANTIHEVSPVTWGERFTIISWFR